MQNYDNGPVQVLKTFPGAQIEFRPLMRQVYMWMGLGLLVTFFIALLTANTPALQQIAFNPTVMLISVFGSLGLVIGLSWGIRRMSATTAAVLFFVYAALLGFTTMAIVFAVYPVGTIVAAFGTTAALFGVMTVIGFTTKVDLSKYSTYFMMALIGLVIAIIVNMFLNSGPFEMLISIFGVILFTALTAYDTQKIKEMSMDPELQAGGEMMMKISILGALTLYLDFVNLFLFLLRLFGSRD